VSGFSPAAVPPNHRLSIARLDALATGRFDRNALDTLRSAERSRRLLLLRALLDYARPRPESTSPLPSVDTAWNLLLRAENAAPLVVAEMLMDPQTGAWVAHALRRQRDASRDRAPLWFHVGQLHTFAAAAAIRAGLDAEMTVPAWCGDIQLPSLGCLRLATDTEWEHAVLTIDDTVRIRCAGITRELDPRSDRPVAGWFPFHSLTSTFRDLTLTLRLDDLSPYRLLNNPSQPAPIDVDGVARWQAQLDSAWRILVTDHPDRAHELATGMASLTPLPAVHRFRPHSTSVEDGFGSAILSEPHDAAQFAVTMVHEFQHSVLNGVRHLVTLTDVDDDPPICYAPWRDDPRPLGALIHGMFAFAAVAEFWAVYRNRAHGVEADLANFEFALWRNQTETVLRSAQGHHALTEVGARFLNGIAERLARLRDQSVPPMAVNYAEAAADHAAGWRACHLQPDPDRVRVAADAWTARRPAPPVVDGAESVVLAGRVVQRLDAKAVLMQIRIADPDLFDRLHAEPQLVAGASSADVAYVAGDLNAAHRLYLTELSETPGRAAAWSGLGLVMAELGKKADLLLRQPELVRAVSERVAADTGRQPAPDELAVWLADGEA
jgi:HEXXH motif-containing protein